MDTFESQKELFFGDLLKAFRQRKKLTQQQLAARLEVTRETVSLWERGAGRGDSLSDGGRARPHLPGASAVVRGLYRHGVTHLLSCFPAET